MIRYDKKKAPDFSRAFDRDVWYLVCRGGEIRTPDLLLPKQAQNPL